MLLSKQRFGRPKFKQLFNPPHNLRGRVGAVMMMGCNRFCIGFAYFPPRPLKAKEMPAYLKCVQLVLQFLQSVVLNLPAGTTPLIFADINTGFGDSQHKEPGDDLYVGMCHHERENEAAVHVRHFIRETGLCIVDTCFDSGPTFWPTRSSSGKRLDHIIAPRDMLERFSACRTYSRAGWHMQLANTSRKWDHWPIVAEFRLLDAQQRHWQQRMEPKTEWGKRLLRDFRAVWRTETRVFEQTRWPFALQQ